VCVCDTAKIKKGSERCKHCALAVVRRSQEIFAPPQTPFGARDGQNLISWRWSLPLPINPVWWGSMNAISSYRGNRPTSTRRPPVANTQTGPITIHCAAKLSAQCNKKYYNKLCAWRHNMPRPSPPPVGAPAPRAPPSRRNVAVVSHAQYVLRVTAAPASRVKAAVSKAVWWPWPLTLWPWKWCPSHVWRWLPLCQFWSS